MPHKKMDPAERFIRHFTVDEHGCWIWTGGRDQRGYAAQFEVDPKDTPRATHWALKYFRGIEVPTGWHADHLCRVIACVNPWHLEPVTPEENVRRRDSGVPLVTSAVTHCPNGHPRTPENRVMRGKYDICRICERDKQRRYKHSLVAKGLTTKGTPRQRTTSRTPQV